jgi:hypothetical protein
VLDYYLGNVESERMDLIATPDAPAGAAKSRHMDGSAWLTTGSIADRQA